VLSGRGLCDELIARPEESYRLCCVVCDLETSRMGAPYIYDISRLRVKGLMYYHIWHSFISSVWMYNCPVQNLKMHNEWVYTPLVLILGAKSLLIFSFKPRPLYPRFPCNSKLYGLIILFAYFGQENRIYRIMYMSYLRPRHVTRIAAMRLGCILFCLRVSCRSRG